MELTIKVGDFVKVREEHLAYWPADNRPSLTLILKVTNISPDHDPDHQILYLASLEGRGFKACYSFRVIKVSLPTKNYLPFTWRWE